LHLKPATKWIVLLTLIVVTLSAFALASTQASLQQNPEEKKQDLFSLFHSANTTISQVFRQLEENGETVPQASLNAYNQALVLAGESESLMQTGDYSEANSKIVEALQKLKESLRIVDETVPQQPTETEINLERTVQLRSTINRYHEQLQRIENLTRIATSAGYNTTTLQEKISTIKNLLETASTNVEQQRFEQASENLAEAKTLSDRILTVINNFAADLKITRITAYINQTQQRLDAIRETAEATSNEASLAAVDNAETSLNNAREYLEEQKINETLSELANSKASEDEAVEYLRPTATAVDTTANRTPTATLSP
jgi:cytochrome c556/predicted Zn-dependent protease